MFRAKELRRLVKVGRLIRLQVRKFSYQRVTREGFTKDPVLVRTVATGERIPKLERSKRLAETTDAFTLIESPSYTDGNSSMLSILID